MSFKLKENKETSVICNHGMDSLGLSTENLLQLCPPCVAKMYFEAILAAYSALNTKQIGQRIYTRLLGWSPCIKMVMYTAALQDSQPNWLYTRLPGVNI